MTGNVKLLSLRLLDKFEEHRSAQLLLLRYHEDRGWGPCFNSGGGPTGLTGLHAVASIWTMDVVAALLEIERLDINATD